MKIFRHESLVILDQLQSLGGKIVDYLPVDKISNFFLDTDFRDRNVIKIVTMNKYNKMLHSDKVNVLL